MFLGRYHRNVVARPDKRCSRVIFLANLCERKCTCPVGGLCTTNGLLNTVLKVCVFPLLNVLRNHTKITSWSILFVWSTVWCSLVIFRMSWFGPEPALNSWTSWLCSRNSSPFPPVSRILGLDEICFLLDGSQTNGPNLSVPKKVWESWFTFPGTKIFNFVLSAQLVLSLNTYSLTSSLSKCIFSSIFPVYPRRVDFSSLVFSLSSHQHSYIGLVFSSRFLDS